MSKFNWPRRKRKNGGITIQRSTNFTWQPCSSTSHTHAEFPSVNLEKPPITKRKPSYSSLSTPKFSVGKSWALEKGGNFALSSSPFLPLLLIPVPIILVLFWITAVFKVDSVQLLMGKSFRWKSSGPFSFLPLIQIYFAFMNSSLFLISRIIIHYLGKKA